MLVKRFDIMTRSFYVFNGKIVLTLSPIVVLQLFYLKLK